MSNGNAVAQPKRRAPPPPPRKDSDARLSAGGQGGCQSSTAPNLANCAAQKTEIPKFLGVQLIELVRVGTKAPHCTCVDVAMHFLATLREELPNTELVQLIRDVEVQINRLESPSEVWAEVDVGSLVERSDDAARFRSIVNSLAKHCRSEQQHRSTYFDDDGELLDELSELKTVCADADRRIVQYCVSEDDYVALQTLSTLFCVDLRAQVRTSLIDALLRLVQIDRKCVTILLESAFAFELARQFAELTFDCRLRADRVSRLTDLVTCRANSTLSKRLVRMLTALFCTGEQLPVALSDRLNVDFIANCLRRLETAANGESVATEPVPVADLPPEDDLAELLFEMLVSFNLHFSDVRSNVLIAAMRGTAADTRTFTEKLLSHFNALTDPVEAFRPVLTGLKHVTKAQYPNCIIKTLADCYADSACADLFYTNDAKALVDIVLRFVADLNAGDPLRCQVLRLTLLVVRSGAFSEHRHRLSELRESVALAAVADIADADADANDADERRERVDCDRQVANDIVDELDRLAAS